MKLLPSILVAISLTACGLGDYTNSDNTVEVSASGLTGNVTLFESISGMTYQITKDGNHVLPLQANQTIFDFMVISSNQQACKINNDLDLVCENAACTENYLPVCAKTPISNIACVTTPCPVDQYQTHGNACVASLNNAWPVFYAECGGLEDLLVDTLHLKPVQLVNLPLVDFSTDPFTIISSSIADDTLTLEFEFAGGCGSHDFSMYADETIPQVALTQLDNLFTHLANDDCEALMRITKRFDLLPIAEIYRRTFPAVSGERTVSLMGLGDYTFIVD